MECRKLTSYLMEHYSRLWSGIEPITSHNVYYQANRQVLLFRHLHVMNILYLTVNTLFFSTPFYVNLYYGDATIKLFWLENWYLKYISLCEGFVSFTNFLFLSSSYFMFLGFLFYFFYLKQSTIFHNQTMHFFQI